jgi:photosystem II stability/assembly factor-like uncharacterized protein
MATSGWRAVFGLLCLAALPGLASRRALGQVDALDRPAQPEPDAAAAVLLAVTRAGRRLVAAGERGIVLLSDDGGRSWRQGRVPVSATLVALCFPDSRRGWAVGHHGVVLRTADGGVSWTRQPGASSETVLLDVTFTGARRGFIVGSYGALLASDDGGEHWVSGDGRLAVAARSPREPPREGRHLYGVRGDGAHVYVVGEQGALYRSADGGETFAPRPSPYQGSFFGLLVRGPQVLIYGLRGHLFLSPDRGETWQRADGTAASSLTAGAQLDDGSILLANQLGQLLRGGGAGGRWIALPTRLPAAAQSLADTGDGAVVVVGAHGASRLRWPGAAP